MPILAFSGQHAGMVEPQDDKHQPDAGKDGHPSAHHGNMFLKVAGKDDQTSLSEEASNVVKASLPAGKSGLLPGFKAGDVETISHDVVRSRAECNQRKKRYGISQIASQGKRQCKQTQADAAKHFKTYDEELLRLVHLQKRTPQRLERPWNGQQTGGKRNHFIANTHALIENQGDQSDGIEG